MIDREGVHASLSFLHRRLVNTKYFLPFSVRYSVTQRVAADRTVH